MTVIDDIIVTAGRPLDAWQFPPVYINTVMVTINPEFGSQGGQVEFPLPLYMQLGATNQAAEIVGKGVKAIGATIKAVTDATRLLLNSREATRLDALHATLTTVGDALIAGSLDWSSARPAVKSAFTVALDAAGGKVFAIVFGAIGTFAAANAPLPPQAKGAVVAGSGLAGYAIGEVANDAWVEPMAGFLTDGLFYGAEAMGWLMYNMVEAVKLGLDPTNWLPGGLTPKPDLMFSDPQPDQTIFMSGAS